MKKILTEALSLTLLTGMFTGVPAGAQSGIGVTINGSPVQFDEPPLIRNDRTLVPIRAIFEAMGMSVHWDESTGKILAMSDDLIITMFIGGYTLGCGNSAGNVELHPMDAAPCIINDRTYVPVRFIAEATGYDVSWNGDTRTVVISGEMRSAPVSEEVFEIKGSLDFYENSVDALDFGKLNNTECAGAEKTEEGYVYRYTTTGSDVVNYVYAIMAQGYELGPVPIVIEDLTIMQYKKDGRMISITYTKNDKQCRIRIC
ncbi:MAG: copper amine oxidase N-terminal domain-containing protein [Candidatus Ornithomonoglobus sp.]